MDCKGLYEIKFLGDRLNQKKYRSCWERGVICYARELLSDYSEWIDWNGQGAVNRREFERALLNGASSWSEFSWGGCSYIYDKQIAEKLCNQTELNRTKHGEKDPSPYEFWLDTQARALYQAANILADIW